MVHSCACLYQHIWISLFWKRTTSKAVSVKAMLLLTSFSGALILAQKESKSEGEREEEGEEGKGEEEEAKSGRGGSRPKKGEGVVAPESKPEEEEHSFPRTKRNRTGDHQTQKTNLACGDFRTSNTYTRTCSRTWTV